MPRMFSCHGPAQYSRVNQTENPSAQAEAISSSDDCAEVLSAAKGHKEEEEKIGRSAAKEKERFSERRMCIKIE